MANSPAGIKTGAASGAGQKRLDLIMGDDATVDTIIEPERDGGWVRVVIRMPADLVLPSVAPAQAAGGDPIASAPGVLES